VRKKNRSRRNYPPFYKQPPKRGVGENSKLIRRKRGRKRGYGKTSEIKNKGFRPIRGNRVVPRIWKQEGGGGRFLKGRGGKNFVELEREKTGRFHGGGPSVFYRGKEGNLPTSEKIFPAKRGEGLGRVAQRRKRASPLVPQPGLGRKKKKVNRRGRGKRRLRKGALWFEQGDRLPKSREGGSRMPLQKTW